MTKAIVAAVSNSGHAEDLEIRIRLHEFSREDSPFATRAPPHISKDGTPLAPAGELGAKAGTVPEKGHRQAVAADRGPGPIFNFEPGRIILTQRMPVREGQDVDESILLGRTVRVDAYDPPIELGETTL